MKAKSKKQNRSVAQKRFGRGKSEERNASKYLQAVDGKVGRPWDKIVTSTGRIGDIHRFQADMLTQHYVGESKYVLRKKDKKDWGKRVTASEIKKLQKAEKTFNKFLIYILHLADCPILHCIEANRHAWLLSCERLVTNKGFTVEARAECDRRIALLKKQKEK
ncbi:hypothetical protein ES703_102033 [subsurface metagenome]